jgi:hypothetical protein
MTNKIIQYRAKTINQKSEKPHFLTEQTLLERRRYAESQAYIEMLKAQEDYQEQPTKYELYCLYVYLILAVLGWAFLIYFIF